MLSCGSWEDHLKKVEKVLERLEDTDLNVNGLKLHFGKPEAEHLGCLLTRKGAKPVAKKVEIIFNRAPPNAVRKLRSFVGAGNHCHDMWIRQSHVLDPLTGLLKNQVQLGCQRTKSL